MDVAPTMLGPLVKQLEKIGDKAAAFGKLLVSPDGSGVNIGIGWKANLIRNGGFIPINEIRFPPRYGVGYTYQF